MRRIIVAPSFDAELLALSLSIEDRFGARAADDFEARVGSLVQTLAASPMIGTRHHDYSTPLYGVIQSPNWIFYRFTDDELHVLHIRDGRRDKSVQTF